MLRGELIAFSVIKVTKIKSNMLQEVSNERPDASEFFRLDNIKSKKKRKKRMSSLWLLSHPTPHHKREEKRVPIQKTVGQHPGCSPFVLEPSR